MTTTTNEKRIIITAKGFSSLDEAGCKNLLKKCDDFLATGKVVWAMADYMGITGAGKGGNKHQSFIKQLEDNSDLEVCVALKERVGEVILGMQTGSEIVAEKAPLRLYFAPLLKSRMEKVEPAVEVSADVNESIEI